METIVSANSFVIEILGKPKYNSSENYRLSKFVCVLEYKNTFVLYSTMTKQLIHLNLSETEFFNAKDGDGYIDLLGKLVENWIMVPEKTNERLLYDKIVFLSKQIRGNAYINDFTILPTTDCNARCYYCFEMGGKRETMFEKTAFDISNYILNVSKGKNIKLHWFGGEPLFNQNAINIICNNLKMSNAKFESSMISNGFLFDEDNVLKAKELWQLKSVQITLDGTEEIYNKTKSYIYNQCESPFRKVYNNIGLLLKNGISVKIRLNIDMHNIKNMYELIETLYNDYGSCKNFKVYPAILFEKIGADKRIRTDEQRKIIYEKYLELCDHLFQLGILNISPLTSKLKLRRCIADNDHSTVILPNGDLCKCEHYSDAEKIGTIYDTYVNKKIVESWKDKKEAISECDRCIWYPNCIRLKKCENGAPPECTDGERKANLFFLNVGIITTVKNYYKENKYDIDS